VTQAPSPIDVIVLAGDRGPDDPLARTAGVVGKTLVQVAGRPMLQTVLETLTAWPLLDRLVVLAPDTAEHGAILDRITIDNDRLIRIRPETSPSLSVAAGLKALDGRRPVLLVTADHPLLKTDWLEQLLGTEADADVTVALAKYETVMQRFPGSRRTRYRFSDVNVCGTNLFVFRNPAGDAVVELWRQIERQRKRPWRIVSLLGWSLLGRYLTGRLALSEALAALSSRAGARVSACLLEDPLSAVDIDSTEDLELVESVISQRPSSCS